MTSLVNDTLVPESVPTDAGDTTQIVHFQFNPLDQARQELRVSRRSLVNDLRMTYRMKKGNVVWVVAKVLQ